ncbi:hypothetical protein GOP47_0012092 [Adiantum capillus-veneris]|uniref:O-fucosyltransferase family protein n=1 Tax=Adiantum capillus-veneris TaxID=13818 RepID=A0A9D4UQS4_ADICA|nr:hypothetical protein GOP47_0012092 [Adiantum capillus-veneris]
MPRRARVHKVRAIFAAPALPLLCGSMLALLALVALVSGPLLDLDSAYHSPVAHMLESPSVLSILSPSHARNVTRVYSKRATAEAVWASKLAPYFYGCSSPKSQSSRQLSKVQSNGYLLIQTSGGLNQQRTGIIDAVVVARILNVTLVVPQLDHKSFWKDSSNFSDIFYEDWFINTLAQDVKIIKELPPKFNNKVYSMRVPRRCKPEYFLSKILPILRKKKAVRLGKFDYRLSNRLEEDLQKLRCRVNYHALRFTPDVETMGQRLVERLRQNSGRYIALHLRFEPDMLAFSGCYYGGGEREIRELGMMRKRWKTLHKRNPDKERRNGKCPLTPEEVGVMLKALGFQSDSHLYVASGDVYGGDSTLAPLKKMFPNYDTKETLALDGELEPFTQYSSRMAAIDYIVCDESNVFITNNNGNMARILAGRRRYFGHKRTVRPNSKRLGSLFLAKPNMTWNMFALKLRKVQRGFMGEPKEMRPGRGQFFENPSACICEKSNVKENIKVLQQQEDMLDDHEEDGEQPLSFLNGSEDEDDDLDVDPDLEDITFMQEEDMDREDDELGVADGGDARNITSQQE